MIGAKTEQGLASPPLTGWLGVDTDTYLDVRCPEWHAHERAGLVRYARLSGEPQGRVFVAPAATEIIAALVGLRAGRAENRRAADAEALPR